MAVTNDCGGRPAAPHYGPTDHHSNSKEWVKSGVSITPDKALDPSRKGSAERVRGTSEAVAAGRLLSAAPERHAVVAAGMADGPCMRFSVIADLLNDQIAASALYRRRSTRLTVRMRHSVSVRWTYWRGC